MTPPNTPDSLGQLLRHAESLQLQPHDLDEAVHAVAQEVKGEDDSIEAAERRASALNNDGLTAQLSFLLEHNSPAEIERLLSHLEKDDGGSTPLVAPSATPTIADSLRAVAQECYFQSSPYLLTGKCRLDGDDLERIQTAFVGSPFDGKVTGNTRLQPKIDDDGYFGADFDVAFEDGSTLPVEVFVLREGVTLFFREAKPEVAAVAQLTSASPA